VLLIAVVSQHMALALHVCDAMLMRVEDSCIFLKILGFDDIWSGAGRYSTVWNPQG
jgi:hypothetical protein